MSKTSKLEAQAAKALFNVIETTSKVVPINSIPSVYCFSRWLDSVHKMGTDSTNYVQSDYYNGSENDLVNIFVEILNLVNGDHCYNGRYVLERLDFLANEGLHMIELQNAKTRSFKISSKEADEVIMNLAKKAKTKKTSKKNKSAKKIRRDKNGRFTGSK